MYPLYHGTDAQFEAFSLDFAARPNMASNGFLGVWFATEREHAQRFGQYCLTVDADVQNVHRIAIDELAKWHRECGQGIDPGATLEDERLHSQRYYADLRLDLLNRGFDAIEVRELDGHVGIVIVLLPERLRIVHR